MFKKILHSIFPTSCILCKGFSKRILPLCVECESELPWCKKVCFQCAEPISEKSSTTLCGRCIGNPPHFDNTFSAFIYEPPIDNLITSLKFHHKLIHANLLAELFFQKMGACISPLPDRLIPVPLHDKRIRQRGFNQALEIAKYVSKRAGIPLDYKSIIRSKYTEPQSSLPAKHRGKNIKNAFRLKKLDYKQDLHGKHIVIIDDVVTTGGTVNEFAKLLKKNGAKRVDVWCCARTRG